MWINHCAAVLRMKLHPHEPFVIFKFYYFHQIRFFVKAATDHSGIFKFIFILIVELEPVTVTFADIFFSIYLIRFASFL